MQARDNTLVDWLDYQIPVTHLISEMEKGKIDYQVPVTHLKGAKGDGGNRRYASSKQWDQKEMECDRREIEIY